VTHQSLFVVDFKLRMPPSVQGCAVGFYQSLQIIVLKYDKNHLWQSQTFPIVCQKQTYQPPFDQWRRRNIITWSRWLLTSCEVIHNDFAVNEIWACITILKCILLVNCDVSMSQCSILIQNGHKNCVYGVRMVSIRVHVCPLFYR
jgi:hypothetical protein